MEFKGTKGRWEVCDQDSNGLYVQSENQNGSIARVYTKNRAVSGLDGEANALLISKAPEMLEMLNEILADKDWKEDIDFNKIKQLIKEATNI